MVLAGCLLLRGRMLDKLGGVENRYSELMELMATPEVASKSDLLRKYGQEQANLEPIVETARRYREVLTQLEEAHTAGPAEY